jgi:hypothetical protein
MCNLVAVAVLRKRQLTFSMIVTSKSHAESKGFDCRKSADAERDAIAPWGNPSYGFAAQGAALLRLLTAGYGTSRHFAAAQQFGRIWSEADINHRAGFNEYTP